MTCVFETFVLHRLFIQSSFYYIHINMEWVLGITDTQPKHWKKKEPCWEDEQLTATSSNSFHEGVHKLCETALSKQRTDDAGMDDHLWNLKISSLEQATQPYDPLARLMELQRDDSSSDEDDNSDEEERYRGRILVAPREHHRMYQEEGSDEYQLIASEEETLTQGILPNGHVIHFEYDFGTTTNLYLKVLSVRPVGARALLEYFEATDTPAQVNDMKALPAYQLPKEQQIDAFYPYFSQAFLSNKVGKCHLGSVVTYPL